MLTIVMVATIRSVPCDVMIHFSKDSLKCLKLKRGVVDNGLYFHWGSKSCIITDAKLCIFLYICTRKFSNCSQRVFADIQC